MITSVVGARDDSLSMDGLVRQL